VAFEQLQGRIISLRLRREASEGVRITLLAAAHAFVHLAAAHVASFAGPPTITSLVPHDARLCRRAMERSAARLRRRSRTLNLTIVCE
jgi:hypothetical protein